MIGLVTERFSMKRLVLIVALAGALPLAGCYTPGERAAGGAIIGGLGGAGIGALASGGLAGPTLAGAAVGAAGGAIIGAVTAPRPRGWRHRGRARHHTRYF
ncbi:hypothetical protein EDE12_1115 [Methylosinus sp. sav-2]|jgi:hypothetical protein|nr:hypothetical protein EDE12_1115 [Methylosinus sp. sav-2]